MTAATRYEDIRGVFSNECLVTKTVVESLLLLGAFVVVIVVDDGDSISLALLRTML